MQGALSALRVFAFAVADLAFGKLGKLQRILKKRFNMDPDECPNCDGGVITAEGKPCLNFSGTIKRLRER